MAATPVLVAVFEISDDANEDRWADASWRAEFAVREAAENAGAAADDVTVVRSGFNAVASTPDGRQFEARITTTAGMASYQLPRRRDGGDPRAADG